MSEFKKSDTVVGADLYLKATADLEESVKRDLQVEDPTPERPLRPILVSLVQSGQYLEDQIREAAGECFDDLGLEPPQQGGG